MIDEKDLNGFNEKIGKEYKEFKEFLITKTIGRLIEVTKEYAPGETDFNEAIYVEGQILTAFIL